MAQVFALGSELLHAIFAKTPKAGFIGGNDLVCRLSLADRHQTDFAGTPSRTLGRLLYFLANDRNVFGNGVLHLGEAIVSGALLLGNLDAEQFAHFLVQKALAWTVWLHPL